MALRYFIGINIGEGMDEDEGYNWIDSKVDNNDVNNQRIDKWLRQRNNIERLQGIAAVNALFELDRDDADYNGFRDRFRKDVSQDLELRFLLNDNRIDNVLYRIGATEGWFDRLDEQGRENEYRKDYGLNE